MKKTSLFAVLLALGCVAFPHRSPAPLTITPGEGASYNVPGAEAAIPDQKDAQTQFDKALEREKKGDLGNAIAGYRKTVHRFPKSTVASSAQFKVGELSEKRGDLDGASSAYEKLIKDYPHSADFNTALEGEFRIGTAYLEGYKQKILGVSTLPSRDRAIAIYKIIVNNAPFSRYAPLAQFNIGQAYQRQNNLKDAISAYQVVVDKYPTDPTASDALYQTAYAYMQVSRTGSYDRTAATRARETFEDYLAEYPSSEKSPQARQNLLTLQSQQTGGSLQIADYYYKQKQFRAAVVYYNDVIRQQPNSPESDRAKARLDAIRAKYGDKYFTNTPGTTAASANAGGVTPKLGDGRLQAQTDTSKRPDYVGPPISAPTPPPVAANPSGVLSPLDGNGPLAPAPSKPAPGDAPPPPVPEGEQPSLPSQ